MKGYLLDTSAVSLLYNGRASAPFEEWLRQRFRENTLFLSSITVQEIQKGITKLELVQGGSPARANALKAWLQALVLQYENSIIVVDVEIAFAAGRLEGTMIARGHNADLADILIAATAQAHNIEVVTANIRDFEALEVACLAPF